MTGSGRHAGSGRPGRDEAGAAIVRRRGGAIVEEVLRLADYNKTLAAKHLGMTRFALDRRLKKTYDE